MTLYLLQNSKRVLLLLFLFMGLFLSGSLPAQDEMENYGPKPTGGDQARAQYESRLKAHRDNADLLVRPGLLADRKARRVEILVEATGLAGDELAEFLLVDQHSSHGYEALLWSFAKPGDVHAALEFIGLKAGTPVHPAAMYFRSNGDRVKLEVAPENTKASPADDRELFPLEELILDKETDKPLPADGFVFAGSILVPPPGGEGPKLYAADVYDPRSVASMYNEPTSVLDVPRQATQDAMYGRLVVNPEYAFEGGTLLTVVMTPGDPDGKLRARNLQLSVARVAEPSGLLFQLAEKDKEMVKTSGMKPVLEKLVAAKRGDTAPNLSLTFGETLPVREVAGVCQLMGMAESMGVTRIDPPAAGQLFYRAFVPDPRWRKPEGRPTQPWELHLVRDGEKVSGEMVWHEPVWSKGSTAPTFKRRAHAVAAPADVRGRLDADARERKEAGQPALPAVLLVFAGPGLTYGEVMTFVRPALSTHDTVHVYVEDKSVEHDE